MTPQPPAAPARRNTATRPTSPPHRRRAGHAPHAALDAHRRVRRHLPARPFTAGNTSAATASYRRNTATAPTPRRPRPERPPWTHTDAYDAACRRVRHRRKHVSGNRQPSAKHHNAADISSIACQRPDTASAHRYAADKTLPASGRALRTAGRPTPARAVSQQASAKQHAVEAGTIPRPPWRRPRTRSIPKNAPTPWPAREPFG
jgi:hypothetical protein